jgi:hypothetical protein
MSVAYECPGVPSRIAELQDRVTELEKENARLKEEVRQHNRRINRRGW